MDDGVSGAQVPFVEVMMVSLPSYEVGVVETTHLTSPDGVKQYIPGLKDPGKCNFTANFNATDYSRIQTAKGVMHEFVITSPEDEEVEVTVDGFITKSEVSFEPENKATMTCEVQLTSVITEGP